MGSKRENAKKLFLVKIIKTLCHILMFFAKRTKG
jgi:hypothetical protein